MPSAHALRLQIEHALEHRFPAALSPAPRVARKKATTGIDEIDELLDGGLPIGAISELTGPQCSGRTSVALAYLGQRTQQGHVCAWVDSEDTLDPESAAANGVRLQQLLWVRCRDVDVRRRKDAKPWARLDQAIRATDLLLQAGGFAAIVLDLGSTAPEHARRIPLATWFRVRQAASRTQCSLIVLGQDAYAQSSAELVLECAALRANASGETVLNGFTYEVRSGRVVASHSLLPLISSRKPPASTWSADSQWDAEKRA
jgi:recombination protein RecA